MEFIGAELHQKRSRYVVVNQDRRTVPKGPKGSSSKNI